MKETKLLMILLFSSVIMSMGSKPSSGTVPAVMSDSTPTADTDLKTSSEAFAEDSDKKPKTPNASAEGVSERKEQTDPSGPHSWVGSRARGKALQTDKFPRPPEHAASGTTQPKTKY